MYGTALELAPDGALQDPAEAEDVAFGPEQLVARLPSAFLDPEALPEVTNGWATSALLAEAKRAANDEE